MKKLRPAVWWSTFRSEPTAIWTLSHWQSGTLGINNTNSSRRHMFCPKERPRCRLFRESTIISHIIPLNDLNVHWIPLVGGFNHLEKYEKIWKSMGRMTSHTLWKIKMFQASNQSSIYENPQSGKWFFASHGSTRARVAPSAVLFHASGEMSKTPISQQFCQCGGSRATLTKWK